MVRCCVAVTKVTADTPGKSMLTAQKLFNGEYGCCHCEAPGENFRTEKGGNIRTYVSAVTNPALRRTHDSLVQYSEDAEREDRTVKGTLEDFARLTVCLIYDLLIEMNDNITDYGCEKYTSTSRAPFIGSRKRRRGR